MTNTTVHTKELLVKVNMHHMAATRKMMWGLLVLSGSLSAFLILGDLFIESFHTLYAGCFFLPLALISAFVLRQYSREKVTVKVQKQLNDNPYAAATYCFEQDHFTVELKGKYRQIYEHVDYVMLEKIEKPDDQTMYITISAALCYVIYEPNGIEEIYKFLEEKMKK